MISIERLTIQAGAYLATNLSFTVETGKYAVLMGRTGCGKTTLLEILCGLKKAPEGCIRLLGQDVTHLRPAERGIGYVPQDLALFATMTVRDQLAFPLTIRGWDSHAVERRVAEVAAMLGIGHLLRRFPQGLSGGEAQRVALGRALAFRPRFLLLDEPLSALDEGTREEMYDLLRMAQRATGVTTLHVTHSRVEARELADVLLVFRDGKIVRSPLLSGEEKRSPILPSSTPSSTGAKSS